MKILALDTSTEYCSVALSLDGKITSRSELAGQRHSEVLIQMLDEMLASAGIKLAHLDGIAFGTGPGSFTGVRIACGVAQGLALGAGLPVVGVCTLQALAQAANHDNANHDKVIAVLDARMGEVYHAAYQKQAGQWMTVCQPSLCLPLHAPSVTGNGWYGVGSGFALHAATLAQRYSGQLAGSDAEAIPQASAIAQLALPEFNAGRGGDAAQARPLYLRDKVALKTAER